MDHRKVTVLVMFDFTEAFDLVDHDILIEQLILVGCSDQVVDWFKSYLTNRTQVVRGTDETLSDSLSILTGVPQGSVLGPLLFAIFIKKISSIIVHCKYSLYADDLLIYLHGRADEIDILLERVQQDVDAIQNWVSSHHLYLNPSKTKAMILGSSFYVRDINLTTIRKLRVDNTDIPYVTSSKILGIYLDNTLSWNN